MLAAQLNELGISQQPQAQPEAPPRNNRLPNVPASAVGGGGSKSAAATNSSNQPPINPLDPMESSDTDSEPEETNERGRNDGTLLASDPPKPL